MVPLDVVEPFGSFLNSAITDAVGNKLQRFENAPYHQSSFVLESRYRIAEHLSVASSLKGCPPQLNAEESRIT
jgi:hypothetical protein